MASLLIRNATILTMNDRLEVLEGAVSIVDGRIASVGAEPATRHDRVVDAGGDYLLPGFIQTHLHLCQTLFRGSAEGLRLLPWLRTRIWPMEAAHTPASLRASARLAAAELLRGGTTAVLTMETVHDTDVVFDAIAGTGLRATIGKCLMDLPGDGTPDRLREGTRAGLDESVALHRRWHGQAGGRLRAAFAPRFVPSCSPDLLREVAQRSAQEGILVHTHASEQQDEIALVRQMTGRRNLEFLADLGLASPRLCAAHCVWVDADELRLMAEYDVKVLHCPGSNLKLGSGVAPVPAMRAHGLCVSLGADGAACNNRLDMFEEMRLAALLQWRQEGPGSLPASAVLWMATRAGAKTLGLETEIGSVEPGKRADLVLVSRGAPHMSPAPDPWGAVVFGASAADVRMTLVDGQLLVDDFRLTGIDTAEVGAVARAEAAALARRAGL